MTALSMAGPLGQKIGNVGNTCCDGALKQVLMPQLTPPCGTRNATYFETRHHAMLLVIAHHCSPNTASLSLHLLNLAHGFTSFHCPIQKLQKQQRLVECKSLGLPNASSPDADMAG